jgi:hypothetical protein
MSLEELIKKNRPHLSTTSIRTYCSLIKNLAKKLDINLNNKHDIKTHLSKILEDMHPLNPRQRKTTLSALVVLMSDGTEDNEAINKIRSMMMKDIQTTKDEDREQKMTEKQKESWISWNDIMKVYNELEKSVTHLWKKESLNKKEFLQLQDYVLLSCLVLIPPRRSLDYCEFKLRGDKANYNYMDKKTFVFNKYKTASVYKKQVVEIPQKLKKIITDWSKKNNKEWLLLDSTLDQPLTPAKLTNRLYNLFDKKVSVNQLRHSYVSDVVLKDMPPLEQLDKAAKDMGNSTETQITQYKKVK